jgi:hypothetical protein
MDAGPPVAGPLLPKVGAAIECLAGQLMVLSRWCLKRERRIKDNQYHRYRKKVVKTDGRVGKDVDVSLISSRGHGNAGVLKDEAPRQSRPVPGDPMYFKLGVRRAHKWYRRSKTDL